MVAERERERDWKIGFWHVPRENNEIADRLAKEGLQISCVYDLCPSFLRPLILSDCIGNEFPLVC